MTHKKKINLEHCTKWFFRDMCDARPHGELVAEFKGEDAREYAYGAAAHLAGAKIFDSHLPPEKRRKAQYHHVISTSRGYELVIDSREDQEALGRLAAAKYHGVYEKLVQDTGDLFGAWNIFVKNSTIEGQEQNNAASRARRSKRSGQAER